MEVVSHHIHRSDSHSWRGNYISRVHQGPGILGAILKLCLPKFLIKLARLLNIIYYLVSIKMSCVFFFCIVRMRIRKPQLHLVKISQSDQWFCKISHTLDFSVYIFIMSFNTFHYFVKLF